MAAQTATPRPAPTGTSHWTPPRTADNQPDLQGIWVDNTITPFERPAELAGRAFLTDDEMKVLKERAARLFNGAGDIAPGDELFLTLLKNPQEHRTVLRLTGDYNQVWVDDGIAFDNRTSQIVDPADGLLPALTPAGQARHAAIVEHARLHPAHGPEDRAPQERCLTFGTAYIGFLQARNNSFHQIIQTPTTVVLHNEMIHEARIIRLDRPGHISAALRSWSGDSIGRWDGDTLEVDTTNFTSHLTFRQKVGFPVSGEHVHLRERLTRIDRDTIRYEATIDDRTTWTTPWTAVTIWRRSSEHMFEYACHEANYGMVGILRGARAEEHADAKRP